MYIGAENIISPLGFTAEENFKQLVLENSAVQEHKNVGFDKKTLPLAKISDTFFTNLNFKFDELLTFSFEKVIEKLQDFDFTTTDTIVIISTTKGNINLLNNQNDEHSITNSASKLKENFHLYHTPLIVSNACISGVMAINTASNLIKHHIYKYAIVIGADIISDFVLWGFQSLFAISESLCKPFDKERNGINLGEGAASVFISNELTYYKEEPIQLFAGVSSNDANHISGPSRNGEGLYRAIQKTLSKNLLQAKDIDYISAHGTATIYNDEMESIAFNRANLQMAPLNSLKAYYGHTLGAAGVIETVIAIQSIRNQIVIKSLGYTEKGTSENLNIQKATEKMPIKTILKTASGFGGCNAALILKA